MNSSRTVTMIFGVLLTLAGASMIATPTLASASVILVLGWMLVFSGLLGTIGSLISRADGWGFGLGLGLSSLAFGLIIMARPEATLEILTLLFSLAMLFFGIFRIAMSMHMPSRNNKWWVLTNGIISVLLGVMILFGLPETAYWILGLYLGIDVMFYGIGMLLFNPEPSQEA